MNRDKAQIVVRVSMWKISEATAIMLMLDCNL